METTMLATIFGRIRSLFPRRNCDPNAELARLQMHLNTTCGGVLSGCHCGGVITPIVNTYPDRTDVVALVCIRCHAIAALEESGTIATATKIADEVPTGAIVH
jgi:hypothetical protein